MIIPEPVASVSPEPNTELIEYFIFMPTIEGARLTRNVTGGEGILIEHFIQKD